MSFEITLSFIGVVCAIIGVLFLIYQFGILPKREDNEAKINMLGLYRTNQRLIDNLVQELVEFSKHNESMIFSGNLTFGGYIKYLRDMRNTELNEELFRKISSETLSKDNCALMIDSLQKQQHSFNQSMMYFKTNFGIY